MKTSVIIRCAVCVIALCAVSVAVASAPPTYQFAFDQASYSVAEGQKVPVTVYLEETVNAGPSLLNSNGVGMFASGVTLLDTGSLPASPAKVASTSDITANSAFNDTGSQKSGVSSSPSIYAYLAEFTDGSVMAYANNPTVGQTHYFMTIGTFDFTGGATPGVTTVQTGTNPAGGGNVNVTGIGNPIDSIISNASVTITTTPEPSSLVLCGIAAFAFVAFRRWTQRRR